MLRLYPSHWRERYEDELRTLIEDRPTRRRDVLDLARGALDARLHPPVPSRVPAVAAIVAGGIWTVWSLLILSAPAPPDWPGYVQEMLLSALAVVAVLVLAVCGAWLRLGDDATRFERLSISVALAGYAAWFVMLVAATVGIRLRRTDRGRLDRGGARNDVRRLRAHDGGRHARRGARGHRRRSACWCRTRSAGSCSGSAGSRPVSPCSRTLGEGAAFRRSRFVLTPVTGRLYRQPIQ